MAEVFLDTVKLYYEESKAARQQVEGLLDKYRANTSTLLTLGSAAVAFFGFSAGPRQPAFYAVAIVSYLVAVVVSLLIFVPIPMRLNVAYNTADQLDVAPPIGPEKIYYDYAVGHQEAIQAGLRVIEGTRLGVANRFRLLMVAIAVLIVAASLSVVFGAEHAAPPEPTHVIIDKEAS